MTRPKYATGYDSNHFIPRDFLRDRCSGFEVEQRGKATAYTANYRGVKILLIDLSKFGGVLTDWLIQNCETERFFWLESKTPTAYATKDHDMTHGEKWLYNAVPNFRFCVTDEDMQIVMDALLNE